MEETKEYKVTPSINPTPKFKLGDRVSDESIGMVFEVVGVYVDPNGITKYNLRFVWDKTANEENLVLNQAGTLSVNKRVIHDGKEWTVDANYESLSQYHISREENGEKYGLWLRELNLL